MKQSPHLPGKFFKSQMHHETWVIVWSQHVDAASLTHTPPSPVGVTHTFHLVLGS